MDRIGKSPDRVFFSHRQPKKKNRAGYETRFAVEGVYGVMPKTLNYSVCSFEVL